jgi:hypothetical protein
MLLVMDATLLFLLGALFIVVPKQVLLAFHFQNLPEGVGYLIGLWGCVFATMAIGYGIAAVDPARHVAWIQVGIARGALECVFGFVCIARGIVTWQQAGLGIIIAAAVTAAYLVLYPRKKES